MNAIVVLCKISYSLYSFLYFGIDFSLCFGVVRVLHFSKLLQKTVEVISRFCFTVVAQFLAMHQVTSLRPRFVHTSYIINNVCEQNQLSCTRRV